jgi:hypothetical protein
MNTTRDRATRRDWLGLAVLACPQTPDHAARVRGA